MPIDWRNAQIGQSLGIDPAIIAQLIAAQNYAGGSASGGYASGGYDPNRPPSEVTRDGLTYSALYDHGTGPEGEAGSGQYRPDAGYTGQMVLYRDGVKNQDGAYFDANGNYQGVAKLKEDNYLGTLLPALALMGGVYGLGSMLGGGAASGAAGAGGFAGDATAAGYGGLDAASASTMGGGASVGGGSAAMGAGGTGLGGLEAGFLGDATAAGYGGLDAASAATMGGGASVNGGMALGAGGMGSTLANGLTAAGSALAGSGLLGPLATVAGAALGAKGQESNQTINKELPEYLRGPVTDLISRGQGLLASQMPIAAAQGALLRNTGQGLLSQPVAGNGFQLLRARR